MSAQCILSGLNIRPLLDQIGPDCGFWNADPCWIPPTAPYCPDNIVLRYDAHDRHFSEWDKPAFDVLDAAKPLVFALMAAVRGKVLGKVGITRMKPGERLAPHIDAKRPVIYERYQIPLVTPEGAVFIVNDEPFFFHPGDAWWFDKCVTHSVRNNACYSDRVAMVVEIHL